MLPIWPEVPIAICAHGLKVEEPDGWRWCLTCGVGYDRNRFVLRHREAEQKGLLQEGPLRGIVVPRDEYYDEDEEEDWRAGAL